MANSLKRLSAKAKLAKAQRIISIDEKYTGLEPDWSNASFMSLEQYMHEKSRGYRYYNYHYQPKELLDNVISWMEKNQHSQKNIKIVKNTTEWKIPTPVYYLCTMMLKGMPAFHPDNPEKNFGDWVNNALNEIIEAHTKENTVQKQENKNVHEVQYSVQERIRENAYIIMQDLDVWLDEFIYTPDKFDPKSFNVLNYFKGKEINQFHAKTIKATYEPQKQELELFLTTGKKDPQLVEGYKSYTTSQLKSKLAAFKEIENACDMFLQEAKVNRKPRTTKSPSKEKLVSKLNYKQNDAQYKIVSIKPQDILQSKELWVFNTKTRKLGVFIAEEHRELSIKGTTIINFDEKSSVAKTLRKPEEQLKEFMSLTKSKQRKFFNEIKSVDTLMTGRINDDIVLLKVNM
jgi:DNA-directed RNA polymerase subunit F